MSRYRCYFFSNDKIVAMQEWDYPDDAAAQRAAHAVLSERAASHGYQGFELCVIGDGRLHIPQDELRLYREMLGRRSFGCGTLSQSSRDPGSEED